ncbi:MAG TPA: hypothetical protein VJZ25_05175 [Gemmatimonadaceae bacterium]|nr:hypothetical protein [Gemmatimonadaceae bacterium]
MLAYRRDDVRELNDAARALMLRAGQLGPDALQLGRREFRVGDRAICRQNDARCDVRNGTRGTVADLDLANQTLSLQTDAGALRRIGARYAAQQLDHAYALTGHAAQGATVDRAFVLLSDQGALREWGYVACSRAREDTRLYIVGDAHGRETHVRNLEPDHASVRIARALTAPSSEQLALESTAVPSSSHASLRALAHRREQLDRARLRAEARLAEAETSASSWAGVVGGGRGLNYAQRSDSNESRSGPPPSSSPTSRPTWTHRQLRGLRIGGSISRGRIGEC